ncbi:LysE family translocator [Marinobacter nanhaiticus D15-8W]|uniref:Lysine transporter LysE n=1 Tax=Marinobacter nanhaiticus D15-8W TaxID=626887 RepID=N6WW55_9GAMM|nr:LysE family transporter [Marinobacter nanhaiticus]ENO15252.1 lysine transporter LysE [Marinobacter nanhaiticus D15-8W]BES69046.1 LysE family translocator [Marinobacter nanhaiticus D15-8W]
MDEYAALLSVATLWVVAAVTPGPNFLVTVRVAVTQSRVAGLHTVAGIILATLLWASAGFLGIHSLFNVAPWMYLFLKLAGGAYLIWLGLKLLWGSVDRTVTSSTQDVISTHGWRAFRLGFITNIANPKTALFVAGLFAVAMPPEAPAALGLMAIALMVTISLVWYSVVAWLFASRRISRAYARLGHWIDRVAGGCFIFFGVRLVRE